MQGIQGIQQKKADCFGWLDPSLSDFIRFDLRSIAFDLVFPVWFRLVRLR